MGKSYVIGNWKMHGDRARLSELASIARHARPHPDVRVGICVPATLIERGATIAQEEARFAIGAQDCHHEGRGPFTGKLSASMLVEAGARMVLVGHSECRGDLSDDDTIRRKAEGALAAGLDVILCIGEPATARAGGEEEMWVVSQLRGSLPPRASTRLIIAYEPIWAIGTGVVPTADQIRDMHRAIRSTLLEAYGSAGGVVPILYGGSVTADSAGRLLALGEVAGVLVGGSSLFAETFNPIIDAAASARPNALEHPSGECV